MLTRTVSTLFLPLSSLLLTAPPVQCYSPQLTDAGGNGPSPDKAHGYPSAATKGRRGLALFTV